MKSYLLTFFVLTVISVLCVPLQAQSTLEDIPPEEYFDFWIGEWKQTWVDNTGDYLDFTGEFVDNKRMFTRFGTDQNGNVILQRMIFYNIQPDSFTWDWVSSGDNGITWDLNWRIRYRRAE